MVMLARVASVYALVHVAAAYGCSSSNAQSWPPPSIGTPTPTPTPTPSPDPSQPDQASVDATLEACISGCGSDPTCLTGCLSDACSTHCGGATSSCYASCLSDPCSAFYGSGSDEPNPDALQACYQAKEDASPCIGCDDRKVKKRATLDCSADTSCYAYTDGTLLCVDESTGEYTTENGNSGNVSDGVDTGSNQDNTTTTTTSSGATPTPTTESRSSTTTGASAASETPTNAVERLRVDAAIGMLGLVAGLVV